MLAKSIIYPVIFPNSIGLGTKSFLIFRILIFVLGEDFGLGCFIFFGNTDIFRRPKQFLIFLNYFLIKICFFLTHFYRLQGNDKSNFPQNDVRSDLCNQFKTYLGVTYSTFFVYSLAISECNICSRVELFNLNDIIVQRFTCGIIWKYCNVVGPWTICKPYNLTFTVNDDFSLDIILQSKSRSGIPEF